MLSPVLVQCKPCMQCLKLMPRLPGWLPQASHAGKCESATVFGLPDTNFKNVFIDLLLASNFFINTFYLDLPNS
jgi:hypothetical protein